MVLILGGFLIGFSQNSDLGWAMVYDWIIINGTFTAIGTLVAGAHPLTILAGFLSAPLTTLHPALGAGMVTGMVEAYLRKPQVGDFIQLRKDTAHLKGWWHNKVARVLLVFFMSTVGAVAGVYTAGYQIYSRLNGG